jgi:hypothetical protein
MRDRHKLIITLNITIYCNYLLTKVTKNMIVKDVDVSYSICCYGAENRRAFLSQYEV